MMALVDRLPTSLDESKQAYQTRWRFTRIATRADCLSPHATHTVNDMLAHRRPQNRRPSITHRLPYFVHIGAHATGRMACTERASRHLLLHTVKVFSRIYRTDSSLSSFPSTRLQGGR